MHLSELSTPLKGSQLEVRLSRKVRGGSILLVYKDARCDMEVLDRVVGPENWQRIHPNGPQSCRVGIKVDGEWVWKEDHGSPSNVESEKGQASDAFKRACFNWSIGRELYEYPTIYLKHGEDEKPFFGEWRIYVEHKGHKPSYIALADKQGNKRFEWGSREA